MTVRDDEAPGMGVDDRAISTPSRLEVAVAATTLEVTERPPSTPVNSTFTVVAEAASAGPDLGTTLVGFCLTVAFAVPRVAPNLSEIDGLSDVFMLG